MSQLLRNAIESLAQENSPEAEEAIRIIAEAAPTHRHSGFQSIYPEFSEDPPTKEELQRALKVLMAWIEHNPSHPNAGAAFWGLGKFADPALIPFIAGWLRVYVDEIECRMYPVGQIVAVLNHLGEDVISGSSFSSDEHGKNLDDAIKYLGRSASRKKD